jgi:hypothetical protein
MNRSLFFVVASLFMVLSGSSMPATATSNPLTAGLPPPMTCHGCWHPPLKVQWQWQLSGPLDARPAVPLYDIDMFGTSSGQVRSLHKLGRRVVCYVDAGSWEQYRPDANRFPKSILGKRLIGWPGERWLDVRKLAILGPIIGARVTSCRKKGFDGIEFDNVDGYSNPTGFHITYKEQLAFNIFLANLAHRNHLAVALKNDPSQVAPLLPYFDFALVEQCFQYSECGSFLPFIRKGKPVLEVEYDMPTSKFCRRANHLNFNAMRKHLNLDPWRRPCR